MAATPRAALLLGNSLVLALCAATLAAALGLILGLVLARAPLRGRSIWILLCTIPPAAPIHAVVTAWILLFGRAGIGARTLAFLLGSPEPPITIYGLGGTILLLGLRYAPLVGLLVAVSLHCPPGPLEEDALLDAGPWRVLRLVTLRLVRPTAAAAWALVALLCLAEYELPALLEVRNVYAVEVVSQFQIHWRISRVLAAVFPYVALSALFLSLGVAGVWHWSAGEIGHSTSHPRLLSAKRPWALVPLCVVGAPVILMVGTLLWHAGGSESYVLVLIAARDSIVYSLCISVGCAAAVATIALALAWALRVTRGFCRRLIGLAVLLPWVVPPPVLGVASAEWWTLLRAYGLDVSDAGLGIATILWLLPPSVAILAPVVWCLDPALIDAARVDGARTVQILRWVVVPLLGPAVGLVWLVGVVLALGEVTLAVLLSPPGRETLGLRLASLLHYAPTDQTAALCLVQLALVLAVTAGALGIVRSRYPFMRSRSSSSFHSRYS